MAPPLSGGLLPSPPLPLHLPLLPPGARVAIIGAGAAGLATASAMAAAGLAPSIFEARPVPGGTWAGGPTTAIYDRLRTNLPVQVMQYAGRPFARGTAAYPPWRDVAAYLEDVAVGVPGEVRVTHSFEYKHPAAYAGRRVVLLGAGASGVDIAVDVADTAAAVYLSHRGCKAAVGAAGQGGGGGNVNGNGGGGGRGGVTEVPALTSLRADGGVGLADGTTLPAIDDVLLCTGYEFTFPFLPPGEGGVTVPAGGATVDGLYRQLVAVASPTLAFVGLPIKVVPLPLFQDQAAWLAAAWTGQLWEYRRRLCDELGVPPFPPVIRGMYNDSGAAKRADPTTYRHRSYTVVGDAEADFRVTWTGEGAAQGLDVTPP
ncbi:hypothetical protein I4F81_004541 [Pyropia yezoensis]|uniref:Uncharacterized protein n=1 Tax=Pyropia yezoensis TaxID=2788 RepID=A0ACC3BW35_PYRYE|nr:hypothetical protein I4F81_004541 [Neopyropia yezoensis]